jgi:hypothetical protein
LARDLGIPVWGCRAEGQRTLLVPGRGDVLADRAREVQKRGIQNEQTPLFQSTLQTKYARLLQIAEDRGLARPPREVPILANQELLTRPGEYFRQTPRDSVFEAKGILKLLGLIGVMETVMVQNRIPPHHPVIIGAERLCDDLYATLQAHLGPDILSGSQRTKDKLPDLPVWTRANAEFLLHGDPHIHGEDHYLPHVHLLSWNPDSDYDQLIICRTPRLAKFASLQLVVNEAADAYAYLDSCFRQILKTPGRSNQTIAAVPPH